MAAEVSITYTCDRCNTSMEMDGNLDSDALTTMLREAGWRSVKFGEIKVERQVDDSQRNAKVRHLCKSCSWDVSEFISSNGKQHWVRDPLSVT